MAHALRSPRLQPGERKALAQELLNQQFQYRQNMAMIHGLPEPSPPVIIDGNGSQGVATVSDQSSVSAEAPKKLAGWKKAVAAAALIGGGAAMPFIGEAVWGDKTETQSVDIVKQLDTLGYSSPPTDLGEDIQRAFKMNPALRDQLIKNVQRTLESKNGSVPGIADNVE